MDEHCPICNSPVQNDSETCPVCGFKFLGSTQSFQPLTFSDDEIIRAPEKRPTTAVLRVVRGPQIEMIFHLEAGPYTVGRSPQCEIFLNDMTVSREHAIISQSEGVFVIKDSNSFNGVWINNESINDAVLHDGDIIQIGAFCLLYQESSEG